MTRTAAKRDQAPEPVELPEGAVWSGNPLLIPFLVPVGDLHEDSSNANQHPERSVQALADSYHQFGQQKPILRDQNFTVRDGNGQLRAAAQRLGWTHIAAIPSDLEGIDLTRYALAANRTPQLSYMDDTMLAAQLRSLAEVGSTADGLGWDQAELTAILASAWAPDGDGPGKALGESQDGFPGADPATSPFPPSDTPCEMGVPVVVTRAQREVFDQAVARLRAGEGGDVSEGRALELICADYLAGAPLPAPAT